MMLAFLAPALGFFARWRAWLIGGVVVSALITVFVFYGNCRQNAEALANAEVLIADLRFDLQAARVELDARNQRIKSMNERQLAELAQARDLLNQALVMSQVLRVERDKVKEELEVTKFELLETIRDDEEFADWVDWDVPTAAWGLLLNAAEGRTD
jgi:hypothetical protein